MAAFFKFDNPIRFDKLTKLGQIRGVDLYVHWTVFLVAAIILAGVLRHPALTLLGLAAYWGVLLIHEIGHLIAAQRLRCPVFSIEIYPNFWHHAVWDSLVPTGSLRDCVGRRACTSGRRRPIGNLGRDLRRFTIRSCQHAFCDYGLFQFSHCGFQLAPNSALRRCHSLGYLSGFASSEAA